MTFVSGDPSISAALVSYSASPSASGTTSGTASPAASSSKSAAVGPLAPVTYGAMGTVAWIVLVAVATGAVRLL
jgi:hypothetical protein